MKNNFLKIGALALLGGLMLMSSCKKDSSTTTPTYKQADLLGTWQDVETNSESGGYDLMKVTETELSFSNTVSPISTTVSYTFNGSKMQFVLGLSIDYVIKSLSSQTLTVEVQSAGQTPETITYVKYGASATTDTTNGGGTTTNTTTAPTIVASWLYAEPDGFNKTYYVFKSDGTSEVYVNSAYDPKASGTYVYADNKLSIKNADGTAGRFTNEAVTLSASGIVFTGMNGVSFSKVASVPDFKYAGYWTSDIFIYNFDTKGKLVIKTSSDNPKTKSSFDAGDKVTLDSDYVTYKYDTTDGHNSWQIVASKTFDDPAQQQIITSEYFGFIVSEVDGESITKKNKWSDTATQLVTKQNW